MESTITAINVYSEGSTATAAMNATTRTATYAVVLQPGFDLSELGELCDYASRYFGVVCGQVLTRTTSGFLTQVRALLQPSSSIVAYSHRISCPPSSADACQAFSTVASDCFHLAADSDALMTISALGFVDQG